MWKIDFGNVKLALVTEICQLNENCFSNTQLTQYGVKLLKCVQSHNVLFKQEAQLSQKDRAMLHVIKYFAKLLKVHQGHLKWHSSRDV